MSLKGKQKMQILIRKVGLVLLGLGLTLTACSGAADVATAPEGPLAFEIVSQGQGPGPTGVADEPLLVALRGDDSDVKKPEGIPVEAKEALQNAIAAQPDAIYVVVSSGEKPSGGYAVEIDSITLRDEPGKMLITVHYSETRPDPDAGAFAALTYPYVIARITGIDLPADSVVFEGPDL